MKIILRTFQCLIVIAPITLAGWLLWQNLAPSGVFDAVYNFGGKHPAWISDLTPGYRMGNLVRLDDGAYRPVVEAPIYFLLRAPRAFQFVRIQVDARVYGQDFKIGARVGPAATDNVFEVPRVIPQRGRSFITYEVTFPTYAFYPEPDGRLRVALMVVVDPEGAAAKEAAKEAVDGGPRTPLFDISRISINYVDAP